MHVDFVQALARGLSVIESFDDDNVRMTLSDVSRRANVSRATARRALLTLQSLGYVGANGDRFFLKARTLRLGYAYLASEPLWSLAQPYLVDLRHRIGQSCSIGVADGDEVVVVARSAAKRIVNDDIGIGYRWPAYCTALGRVLLCERTPAEIKAYLARTTLKPFTPFTITSASALAKLLRQFKQRGWSSADQQMDIEMRSISVPITDAQGKVVAAINTNGRAHLMDMAALEREYLPALRDTAKEISAILAARQGIHG